MPYVSNMPDDEGKSPSQGAVPATGGAPVQLTPTSGVVGAGGGPGAKTGSPAGGQFATLNQYINANQGRAEPLAGKITSGINQQYNTLQGQNESTLNDINSQIGANATPSNANDIIAQEAANPVSFTENPGNVSSFQNLLKATYSGPASAEGTTGFTAQQNAVNNAIATGQQTTTTDAGRQNLLSQTERRPTAGVTALNSAILSQSPTALSSVENAYKPFGNLLTQLNTGASAADQQIAQNQTNASQANAKANQAISDQIAGLQTKTNQELTAAQKQANDYNAAVQKYASNAGAIQANLAPLYASLGQQFAPSYNLPTIGTAVTAPTVSTVATPEEIATSKALATLSGQSAVLPSDAGQAGTFTAPSANFDLGSITSNLAQPLLSSVQAKIAALAPLARTDPNAYNLQTQQIMKQFNDAAKYLNQFNPNIYKQVPGSPDNYWVYPQAAKGGMIPPFKSLIKTFHEEK